eukprot:m.434468 g.434468  ORF g.434468 m.434468 type:complete len:379 (+) comp17721_c0_seq1:72-1208(+)
MSGRPRSTRAVVLRKFMSDPNSELAGAIETVPLPTTLIGTEVEIKMVAMAVNFADNLVLRGKYQIRPPLPYTPGTDFAGVVTRVGPNVTHLKLGDRVSGGTISGRNYVSGRGLGVARGGFAEDAVLPEDHLRKVPATISHAQAAMVGTTYGTAHYALKYEAKVKPDEVCLIHAAAGALGLAACQVAKACGATVVATAGSLAKLDVARRYGGADIAINYRDENWVDAVRKALGGKTVDIVFDPVGLPASSSKLMGYHSRLLVLGFTGWNNDAGLSGEPGPHGETGGRGNLPVLALNRLLVKHCSVIGIYLFAFADAEPELAAQMWREISEGLEVRVYQPVVYTTLSGGLAALPKALSLTMNRETYGKVVVGFESQRSQL